MIALLFWNIRKKPILDRVARITGRHGDLDMAPFAPGMSDGFVFHSFMTRELAIRRSERVVQGNPSRRAFFNPMWRFMTDRPGQPSGTYYWNEPLPDNHFWYTLDQV